MPLDPLVEPADALGGDEAVRTSRHRVLAGFGDAAQRRLAAAHVAVIGAGGLGSPVILALAAAGIGTLTVIDDDVVELSNLQRQVLHRVGDVGRAKVSSAERVARELSPTTTVRAIGERLTDESARRLLDGAHLVIDGSDTFETRQIVAAACEGRGIPLVWGVVQEFHAQVTVFWNAPTDGSPAIRLGDLYPPASTGDVPSCAQVGVLGSLCLQSGGIMATEAIKLLTGVGDPLLGRVLVIDALRGRFDEVALRPSTTSDAGSAPAPAILRLDATATRAAQSDGATIVDVREPFETASGVVPGSIEIPLASLLADPSLAGTGPVVVVCRMGQRAARAAEALEAAGVRAAVLAGGIEAWDAALEVRAPA